MNDWHIMTGEQHEEFESMGLKGGARAIEANFQFGLTPKIPGICRTCLFSMIYQRKSRNEFVVRCQRLNGMAVPEDLVMCSQYRKPGTMDLMDMHRIGHIIEIANSVGFKGKKD